MGRWLMTLLLVMSTSLAARAIEAYAYFTGNTLTFYYDNLRSTRHNGETFSLNTGPQTPGWISYSSISIPSLTTQIVFDPSFADARPTSTHQWFCDMLNLQTITGISYLNTSQVIYFSEMFLHCPKLTSLDVSGFDTSNARVMNGMFGSCSKLVSLDLSGFNTSKVNNMQNMFAGCSVLASLDVTGFNTSNVTDMSFMFSGCKGLTRLDLRNFNTSKVTTMQNMFASCIKLSTIYAGSGWSTTRVTSSSLMFSFCNSLVGGQGTAYDDSNPKDKTYAHIDGGTSNPGYLTDPDVRMAYACYTPSNTTLTFYYDALRYSRTGTTYDLNTGSDDPDWNLNDPDWYTDGTNANVTKVVFAPSFAAARPTTTQGWFFEMSKLQTITGISNLNTSEVTDMSRMFAYCGTLTSLDVSGFNTAKVTSMLAMFYGCSNLTSLDVSGFNTAKVTDMNGMFSNCHHLTSLDVSHFNTAKVTNMYENVIISNHLFSGLQHSIFHGIDIFEWPSRITHDIFVKKNRAAKMPICCPKSSGHASTTIL